MPNIDDTQNWFIILEEFVQNLDVDIVGSDMKTALEKNYENIMDADEKIRNEAFQIFWEAVEELDLMEEYKLQRKLAVILEELSQ